MDERVAKIREQEVLAHTKMYQSEILFSGESWLKKPVRAVMELLPILEQRPMARILDLGCGVGRNCIPLAQALSSKCQVEAVDYLEIAIEKLIENAERYGVKKEIRGITSTIEDFRIRQNTYDLIMAISALEHLESKEQFLEKLDEMKLGVRAGGVMVLIMNSEVREFDLDHHVEVTPQFEINWEADELLAILGAEFSGWEILEKAVAPRVYPVGRVGFLGEMRTRVVRMVIRKRVAP